MGQIEKEKLSRNAQDEDEKSHSTESSGRASSSSKIKDTFCFNRSVIGLDYTMKFQKYYPVGGCVNAIGFDSFGILLYVMKKLMSSEPKVLQENQCLS